MASNFPADVVGSSAPKAPGAEGRVHGSEQELANRGFFVVGYSQHNSEKRVINESGSVASASVNEMNKAPQEVIDAAWDAARRKEQLPRKQAELAYYLISEWIKTQGAQAKMTDEAEQSEPQPRPKKKKKRKEQPEPAPATQDTGAVVNDFLKSLKIPDLRRKAKPPKIKIVFDTGTAKIRGYFHWAVVSENKKYLFLGYDSRFQYGQFTSPPDCGQNLITVLLPDRKLQCFGIGLEMQFGVFQFVGLLLDDSETTQAENEEPIGKYGFV